MRSLERRLQVGLTASILALIGVMWLIGNSAVRALTEDFIGSRLEHDADSLLAALAVGQSGPYVRPNRMDQVYDQPLSGHYYLVRLATGEEIISRSLWDHSIDTPVIAPGERRRWHAPGPAGQQLLVFAKGVRKQGVDMTVTLLEDMTPLQGRRDEFRRNFILLGLGGMLALLVVQSLVVRRSFKRLETVREEIRRLGQGQGRQLSEDVPSEILPLVREFNHLLALLSQRLERSRNALGNLAHALKGPLNLLVRHFDADDAVPNREAGIQVERIRQLMERELKRARLAGQGMSASRFDPEHDMPGLVGVLEQVHRDKSPAIDWQVEADLPAFGDREDMLELLGNLLDNACKWADRKVSCRLSRDDGVRILIADDGRGISADAIERMSDRGVRLDENVEGHGLGLAIAKDIVKVCGGEIRFSRSPDLGGLQVDVRIPVNED